MEERSKRDNYRQILLLLIVGSALLIFSSIYLIRTFSIQFGIGAGAYVQANGNVLSQSLQPYVSQLVLNNQYMLESSVETVLALLAFLLSFVLYIRRTNRYDDENRRYLSIHTTSTVVYIILFAIIYPGATLTANALVMYLGYFGMIVCIIIDAYLEYDMRAASSRRVGVRNIGINPNTPYTNILNLRTQLFSKLKGNLRIVDKHFNSDAIANLHRLVSGSLEGIDSITVITSPEMLDSKFASDYRDLAKELGNSEVALEVKVMNGSDAAAQHERFILDDSNAFKIPPLNIINKKSEHIIKINLREARERFDYLQQRATKFENFTLRQGKGEYAN